MIISMEILEDIEEISPERTKPQNDRREGIKYIKIRGILSPRYNNTKFQGIDHILKGGKTRTKSQKQH